MIQKHHKTVTKKVIWLIIWGTVSLCATAALLLLGMVCPTCLGVGFIITGPLLILVLIGILGVVYEIISLHFVEKE